MSMHAAVTAQIRPYVQDLHLPPEVEQQVTSTCLRAQQQPLSALFDLIDQQGRHGAQRAQQWRTLISVMIGRMLISGLQASTLYEAYRNASLHNQIMGRGWHLGPHLIHQRGELYIIHDDVHQHT